MFTKFNLTPKTITVVVNWLWNGVIAGLLLHLGDELTMEQAIVIVGALICTTLATFVWRDFRPDITAELFADTEHYITEMVGDDEDIRGVIVALFKLLKKVNQEVQRSYDQ